MYLYKCIYIYSHIKISIYVYIVVYITKLSIYTIFETTEPASKFYWINQQVQPKPLYIYIYIYICIYIGIYIYTHTKISIYVYIVVYITKLSIYTIAETMEPASKFYWINQALVIVT